MKKPSGGQVVMNAALAYAKQKGFDLIRPAVKFAVRTIPGLAIDTPAEKIVTEIVSAFPGIVESYFPDHAGFVDALGEITREVINELKVAGEGSPKDNQPPAASGQRSSIVAQNIWYFSKTQRCVALGSCPEGHHFLPDGSPDKSWRQIDVSQIVAASIPTPTAVAGSFCLCASALKAETAPAPKPQAAAPAARTKPPSLVELCGEVMRSGDAALIAKVKKFWTLVAAAKLSPQERHQLEYCDTVNELHALLECTTAGELKALIGQLVHSNERGTIGDAALHLRMGVDRGVAFVSKQWKDGQDRVPEQARILQVLQLCRALGTTRNEVYTMLVLAGKAPQTEDDLTEADIRDATKKVAVSPGVHKSPIDLYREQRNATAGTPKRGGLLRRLVLGS